MACQLCVRHIDITFIQKLNLLVGLVLSCASWPYALLACLLLSMSTACSQPTKQCREESTSKRNRFHSIILLSSSLLLLCIKVAINSNNHRTTSVRASERALGLCLRRAHVMNILLRFHEWVSHALSLRLWRQRDTTLLFYIHR